MSAATALAAPVIELQGVGKDFVFWAERPHSLKTLLVEALQGKFRAGQRTRISVLENINFSVRSGEFVGIMGKNGAGKSTLFKILAGIYLVNRGRLEVRGSIAPLIELGAGFNPELSGYENVFLNAAILGFGRKATFDALPGILAFAELGDMIYMPVKNYSSGMLVRLGFAIGTHLPASILLVDEVLAVGDAKFQQKCIARVKQLQREGTTILLVTHDPHAVRAHCERAIVLGNQTVLYDGEPNRATEVYLSSL